METADLEAPRAPTSQGRLPHRRAALPGVQLKIPLLVGTVTVRPEDGQVQKSNRPWVKEADCLGLDDATAAALEDGDTPEAGIVKVPALLGLRGLLVLWGPEHQRRHQHQHQTSHCRSGANWLARGADQPA